MDGWIWLPHVNKHVRIALQVVPSVNWLWRGCELEDWSG